MTLTKVRLGELVKIVDERNHFGIDDFRGLDINKNIIPTVADTSNLDASKYKVLRENRFVFSGMQTGRDRTIRIALFKGKHPVIVSPAYTTFEVIDSKLILPEYFFMLFNSKEMDRYGWFVSDSSVRANLDWEVFCNIEKELPSIEIQRKYVKIYNALEASRTSSIAGLQRISQTLELEIDRAKSAPRKPVGTFMQAIDRRNSDGELTEVQGLNVQKQFMPSKSKVSTDAKLKYKVIRPGEFGYSAMQTGRDKCIRIALNSSEKSALVSPAYSILKVYDDSVLAEYVQLWFSRKESDRFGWFASDASVRASLDLPRFFQIEIPVPSRKVQSTIVDLYKAFQIKAGVCNRLEAQLKDLCPILIRGSVEEAMSLENKDV